jgi:8-oxo-dGTP diphosphatase
MTLPQQPLVSIDTVPFLFRDGALEVVLANRIFEPFLGEPALPGVLLSPKERLAEAAVRALKTKAGIEEESIRTITGAGVFDNPDRDPRGPTLSIVHAVVLDPAVGDLVGARARGGGAGTDRAAGGGAAAVRAAAVQGLPFDHDAIIVRTAGAVLDALWIDRDLTRALLGERFTTASAARLARELALAACRPEPQTGNLGRDLAKIPWLVKTADAAPPSGRGRPAAGWAWQ